MAAGLVSARVQRKVDHQSTSILRGDDVSTAESVRNVVAVERRREVIEDGDTVSLNLQGINGLRVEREVHLLGSVLRGALLKLIKSSQTAISSIGDRDINLRNSSGLKNIVSDERKTVPVAVLVKVSSSNVNNRAHANEDALNGPLHLAHKNLVGRHGLLSRLESVDADERETNTLDVDIVNLGIHEDVVDVKVEGRERRSNSRNRRASSKSRSAGNVLANSVNLKRQGGTLGTTTLIRNLLLNSKLKEKVTGAVNRMFACDSMSMVMNR